VTEQINWGNLIEQAGKELEPVPKGTYDVVVEDASDTQTSTQKLMYKLKFRIQGGASANRVLWNNITLTTDNPTALAMFFRNMDALGLDRQYFSMNPSPSDVAAALVGRTVRVVIDHRLYQGSMRENVKQMMKATGVMGIPGMPSSGAPAGIPSPMAPAPAPVPQPSAPVSAPVAPQQVQTPAPVVATPPAPVQPSPDPTPPPVPEVATPVQPTPPPPVPAPVPEPEAPAAPAAEAEDPDMAAFLAFKASQAAAAAPAETPVQPATPAGPPAPPPVPF